MSATARRTAWHLTILWIVLACLRWLAALPITAPRIFRDELLHWQMAKAVAFHTQFLVAGQPVDYPALLYPTLLSVAAHVSDMDTAFRLAQALNAIFVSTVVWCAYGLAREFCAPRVALAVAALAGLVPGAAYSALIMEENVYYPLFVLACWLCFRVITRGRRRDAAACAVALCLTYFAKPVAVPLVLAYVATLVVWAVVELRRGTGLRERATALAIRLAPVVVFGLALVIRSRLVAHAGSAAAPSGLLLSRFYADELGGPLLPPFVPLAVVSLALLAALTLGAGIAPIAALLGSARAVRGNRRRLWLSVFAVAVAAVYVLAAARHTMVMNDVPRIHERYIFAAGPLFITLFFAERPLRLRPVPIVVVCILIALVAGPLGHVALSPRTWGTAPSLTLAAGLRNSIGPRVAMVAMGALALATCLGVVRARDDVRVVFACLASVLVLLNAGWYATLYRQRYLDAPLRLVHTVQHRLAPGERALVLVQDTGDPLRLVSEQARFWLDERVVVYWAGTGPPPWYAEQTGTPSAAVSRTTAAYVVADPTFPALCPRARLLQDLEPERAFERAFPAAVFRIGPDGCGTTAR